LGIEIAVKRARCGWSYAFTVVESYSVAALTFTVDVVLVAGADRVAESAFFDVARFAKTSITEAVIVVPWGTVSTSSLDTHILRKTNTSLSTSRVEFIDTLAHSHDTAFLFISIVGLSRLTFRADTLDDVVTLGAVAFPSIEVVELICSTLYSADSLVNIIELACSTLSAVVVDQIVARFTHTSSLNPVLIDCTNWRANSIATLPAYLSISIDTDTALIFLIIDLSFRITNAAQFSYQIVSRQASTSSDCRIPYLIRFTSVATDTIDFIVDLIGRTNTT
jgi:hypothetical protein